ncbi:MAG: HD domain-containing protein [Patescibacteria group bacterium]
MNDYDFLKIRDEVIKMVKEANDSPNNFFGDTVFNFHILPVVKHSLNLGKVLKADLEVLELAALLHDYAGILNFEYYKDHHEHGARLAKDILMELNYPEEKIKQVQDCILNHRGSVFRKKESIEEKIIASADAMAHITELPDMFYLTYGIHKHKTKEGIEWLRKKIEKSWNKIELDEGKELVRKDFEIAMYLLNKF